MDPFFSLVNTASRDIALLACFWTAEPFADLPPLAEEASKSAITDYRSLHEPTEESDSRRRRSLEIHKGRMQNGESAGREGQEDSASTHQHIRRSHFGTKWPHQFFSCHRKLTRVATQHLSPQLRTPQACSERRAANKSALYPPQHEIPPRIKCGLTVEV